MAAAMAYFHVYTFLVKVPKMHSAQGIEISTDGRMMTTCVHGKMTSSVEYGENGVVTYRHFYPDGTPQQVMSNKGLRRIGEYSYYHENGKLKVRANYVKGKLDGEYAEYDEKGRPTKKCTYAAGELVGCE